MSSIQPERPNINFHKYYDSVLVIVKNEVYRAFLWLYQGESQYVGDFLKTTPRGMKRISAIEKAALGRRESPVTFDISFVYTLLQHTCGLAQDTADIWNKPINPTEQQSLEHSLYQLKQKRNALSHEPQTLMHMDEVELETRLNELRHLCTIVIKASGRKANRSTLDIDRCLDKMQKAFDEVQTKSIPSGFTPNKWALLARQEIRRRHPNPSPSSDTYVQPLLHTRGQNGRYQAHLKLFSSWRCEDGAFPKTILVAGEAGTGKTSMCRHIHDTWVSGSTDIVDLQDFELAIPVTCSSVKTPDLVGFLHDDLLRDTISSCGREETSDFHKKIRILWLIDGFEEATPVALELLRTIEKQGEDHLMFITTKPKSTDDVRKTLSSNDSMCEVCLSGICDDGRKCLMEKMLQGNQDNMTKFSRDVAALGKDIIIELANPLKLTLIMNLWSEGKLNVDFGTSLFVLYNEILNFRSKKLVDILKSKNNFKEDAAQDFVDKWTILLYKVAFDLSMTNQFLTIDDKSQKILKSGLQSHLVSADDWLSIFLQCNSNDREGNPTYSFLHNSHQHFLAARHVCTLINTKKKPDTLLKKLFRQNISSQNIMNRNHYYLILLQVVSHLSQKPSVQKPLAKVLVELLLMCNRDFDTFEVVKSAGYSQTFAKEVSKYAKKELWLVDDDTVKAAMTLLEFAVPSSIDINIKGDPNNIQLLPDLIKLISSYNIFIRLYIKQCFMTNEIFSDKYLEHLCASDAKCSLIRFDGKLSADGCRHLLKMTKLRILRLHIQSSDVLNAVLYNLHRFSHLDMLYLSTYMEVIKSSVSLHNVEIKYLTINLFNLDESHIEETALAVSNIYPEYKEIKLGHISAGSVVKFVQILEEKKVRVRSLLRVIDCPSNEPSVFQVNYGPIPLIQPISEFHDQWRETRVEISENELGIKQMGIKTRGIPSGNIQFLEMMSDSTIKTTIYYDNVF